MAGRVYVETTIPSAYVSTRSDPTSVHRRELTLAWWADQAPRYDVSISEAVVLELAQGDYVRERLVPGNLQATRGTSGTWPTRTRWHTSP
jgi:hypothetical protein